MSTAHTLSDAGLGLALARAGLRCGIDEAGRGTLAGPVVAAALVFKSGPIAGLADSKELTKKKREKLYAELESTALFGIGVVQPSVIDAVNILQANFLAMEEAVASLVAQLHLHPSAATLSTVLVDGNYVTAGLHKQCLDHGAVIGAVIQGDKKVLEISAASIIAKVFRDRLMAAANLEHPGYGFDVHSGYDTAAHRASLNALGACAIHRRTFRPVAAAIALHARNAEPVDA
jgi:ribonuclease HII